MTKEELRRIELILMPPIKKGKEPSSKEKLHFWWADVKLSVKDWTIILAKAYVVAIIIFVLSYMTVHYLRQVLPS